MLFRQQTLDLPHGELQTPILFPVRNLGKRSSDNTPQYIDSIPDLPTAMINARAIRNRDPMWDRLTNGVSLREEMNVPEHTIVYADSGGFDFTNEDLDTTPEETLATQRQLKADIIGTVDIPLSRQNRSTENQRRIDQSINFALAASEQHNGEASLFASVHGYDPETIRNSIRYLEKRGNFDGYALGSLVPVRTDYTKVTKLVLAARTATDKHLHVYGLGGLVYQPLLLYLGVDSFDSSAFIRSAGNRNYLIPGFGGEELWNIDDLEYLPCSCPICGERTLEEIRADRNALTQHNLWALTTELRRFRYVSSSGRDIEDYLDLRFRGNEVTQRAYRTAKQQVRRLA
ncbi:tRNA-guanine transglycosylase [Natronosalvus rutilus]|uniref:tRNA-guanine transglycosylase n=1 Tax=Natronosalvus rutilus TaxID=2953753 RepID=A0A9E7NEK6_9EURY|nr:tRNA-guanine transglycosylase [Natronosalvus rutilus]UTF55580.1 tRNA-guanine transglycosylase [Natronosalvus rutilus]